jgi:hypothetical protein
MCEACADMRRGRGVRQSARKQDIPYTTLCSRLQGCLPLEVAHQDEQRLSIVQEDDLADWVLFQASIRKAPTYTQIRELA